MKIFSFENVFYFILFRCGALDSQVSHSLQPWRPLKSSPFGLLFTLQWLGRVCPTLYEAHTTSLWLKKTSFNSLRLQEAGFMGLTRRSFRKRKRNETVFIFSSFWKILNLKFQNFPTFWLPFWLSQVTSEGSRPPKNLEKNFFFFWFRKNKKK